MGVAVSKKGQLSLVFDKMLKESRLRDNDGKRRFFLKEE